MAPVHYPLLALSSPRRNLYIPISFGAARPRVTTYCAGQSAANLRQLAARHTSGAVLAFHGAVDVAFGIPRGGAGALVVELFALAEAQLQLDPPALEVERERHQGVALQLDLLREPPDLVFVRQQLAGAHRIPVEDVALFVGADVHALHHQFAVLHLDPGVLEVDRAGAQAFDLGAHQGDAGLQRLDHKVFVTGLPVHRDGLDRLLLLRHPRHPLLRAHCPVFSIGQFGPSVKPYRDSVTEL